MIEAKIVLHNPIVAKSVAPDNPENIITKQNGKDIVIHMTSNKLTSLIATLDDYLMNAKIAEEICELTCTSS